MSEKNKSYAIFVGLINSSSSFTIRFGNDREARDREYMDCLEFIKRGDKALVFPCTERNSWTVDSIVPVSSILFISRENYES